MVQTKTSEQLNLIKKSLYSLPEINGKDIENIKLYLVPVVIQLQYFYP